MRDHDDAIPVTNMLTLQLEMRRLRKQCRQMEDEIGTRAEHLRDHFGTMAFNSIFPGASSEKNLLRWSGILLKTAWKNKRIQSLLLSALISILEFVAVRLGVNFLGQQFEKGKEKKAARAQQAMEEDDGAGDDACADTPDRS